MEAYQQRVFDELESLNQKILALASFTEQPTFNGLHQVDRDLLHKQLKHMKSYANVLEERVHRFVNA